MKLKKDRQFQCKGVTEKVVNADLDALLKAYDAKYFDNELVGKVDIEWSNRMTLCAGITVEDDYDPETGQGKSCTIRLSKCILQYRTYTNLKEILVHEFIHAWLFLSKTTHERLDGDDGHGPDFLNKMKEINTSTGLRMTVYHSFKDEVEL